MFECSTPENLCGGLLASALRKFALARTVKPAQSQMCPASPDFSFGLTISPARWIGLFPGHSLRSNLSTERSTATWVEKLDVMILFG